MTAENYSLKKVTPILIEEGINKQYIERFSRIAELFGYDNKHSNIIDFCALIVDDPVSFKNDEKITQKWKARRTINEMIRSMKIVCSSDFMKDKLGKKQKTILKELENYRSKLVENVAKNKKKALPVQQNDVITPPEIMHINNAKTVEKKTKLRPELYKLDDQDNEKKPQQKDMDSDHESDSGSNSERESVSTKSSFPSGKNNKKISTFEDDKYRKIMIKMFEMQKLTQDVFAILHDQD